MKRCADLNDIRSWVKDEMRIKIENEKHGKSTDEHGRTRTNMDKNTDEHGRTRTNMDKEMDVDYTSSVIVRDSPCSSMLSVSSVSFSELIANAALSLLNLCCYFLDRQLAVQAKLLKTRVVLQKGFISGAKSIEKIAKICQFLESDWAGFIFSKSINISVIRSSRSVSLTLPIR